MTFSYPEHWNALDGLLVVVLCVVLPAEQWFSRLHSAHRSVVLSQLARTFRSVLRFGVPIAILTCDWWVSGRPASALGLDFPISPAGQIALVVAAIASAGMVIASNWPIDAPKQAEAIEKLKSTGLLVQTRGEIAVFIPQAILIGCGSEVLFRGFLLWAFVPLIGTIGSIMIAGFAYALAHGFRNWRGGIGTLTWAILFAAAYAFTQSLWWLMLFHTVVGLNAGWIGYRLARASNAKPASE